MTHSRVLVLAFPLVLGCPKQAPVQMPDFQLADWRTHSGTQVTYTEHTAVGPTRVAAEQRKIQERCRPAQLPEGAPELALSELRICSTIGPEGSYFDNLQGVHSVGEVYFGVRIAEADWRFHSPKISIPTSFSIGDSWSARHDPDSRHQLRRCDVVPSPFCADGAAITCLTLAEHKVTWVRNNWCPGHGHVGHEGMVVTAGQAPMWSWSTGLSHGERAAPEVDIDQRPFPDPALLGGIADMLTAERLHELSPDEARLP